MKFGVRIPGAAPGTGGRCPRSPRSCPPAATPPVVCRPSPGPLGEMLCTRTESHEQGNRSILDKLCRGGSFRVREHVEKKQVDFIRRDIGNRSVFDKLCKSGSYRVKDDSSTKKLSSGSFNRKEKPTMERHKKGESVFNKLCRSRSFHGREISKEPKCALLPNCVSLASTRRTQNSKDVDSGMGVERPKAYLVEGSLQATVYTPRHVLGKSGRPATVLLVYPTRLDGYVAAVDCLLVIVSQCRGAAWRGAVSHGLHSTLFSPVRENRRAAWLYIPCHRVSVCVLCSIVFASCVVYTCVCLCLVECLYHTGGEARRQKDSR
ncbi:hypothetical protein J6590_077808 [Homalodisca vitripennis]|nr:hypothetical protein J6590_077808 [Homalodisca vitripennis]